MILSPGKPSKAPEPAKTVADAIGMVNQYIQLPNGVTKIIGRTPAPSGGTTRGR
jgi:hypothetical protein